MAPLAALLVLTLALAAGAAESATDAASAPAAAGPLNLTAILEKGGQYTTFLRLLKETQVGTQIESQLNNSFNGMTIFAPTDNAFNNLKAGTLNSLATQQQVSLVLFHVLPRYYSPSSFETTSNPVSTQASGRNGVYTVNITSTTNQVNVSTGVNEAPVNNKLYMDFPLAVYSVDQVLLPSELFGVPAPAASPLPRSATAKPKDKTKAPVTAADAPEASADQSTSAAGLRSWTRTAEGVLLLLAMSVASLLL